ncbi:hypothetical protein [Bacillus sp. T3]|uniref:hypothetical protein n=1 Tax=Bacillus sp. T3 TaxID=467262 RepID=UPI002981AC04|nr:hypothetical protein [Bacillus sp. T3]
MQISKLKPDLNSILHFFDVKHNFNTRVNVYFTHNKQQLRAIMLFPLHRKDHFTLEKVEVFHHNQWANKKGDHQKYGMALSDHYLIVLLGNYISSIEMNAQQQLECRFRDMVSKLASMLKIELQNDYPLEFEVSHDYLSILTQFEVNGERVSGRIETNYYFPHTVNENEFVEEIVKKNTSIIMGKLNQHETIDSNNQINQKVFVTTIPLLNPVSDQQYLQKTLEVFVQSKGYCRNCSSLVSRKGNLIKIDLLELDRHIDDLLLIIVGDTFECEGCLSQVKKDCVLIKDIHKNELLAERKVKDLGMLGFLANKDDINHLLTAAVEHLDFFRQHEEAFWSAYTFVALAKWTTFLKELTRKELYHAFDEYFPKLSRNETKESLISKVMALDLTEDEKGSLWRKANESIIYHYLFITVFGWDMAKEIGVIGQNRAEFIFQYLPAPNELKPFYKKHELFFAKRSDKQILAVQDTIDLQHQQIRQLQQENGRLTQKLGNANARINELELASFTEPVASRNKTDILKIQQLKGLIEELKSELSQFSKSAEVDDPATEIVLTEEKIEQESDSIETILGGKQILILGGHRARHNQEWNNVKIITHDARNLDPTFYEALKNTNIIVVLIRFISHRAMWEAKEYAILEGKPIYFTSFINIPTILAEVAMRET